MTAQPDTEPGRLIYLAMVKILDEHPAWRDGQCVGCGYAARNSERTAKSPGRTLRRHQAYKVTEALLEAGKPQS